VESYGPELHTGVGICFILAYVLIILVSLAVSILIYCKLASKAGYHWAMGLLMLVPIANIVFGLIYTFGQWPIQRELEALKQGRMAPPPEGQPHESFRGV